MSSNWDMFDAITGDHPMFADIEDWFLPPYSASFEKMNYVTIGRLLKKEKEIYEG